jgi:hypothetical protein
MKEREDENRTADYRGSKTHQNGQNVSPHECVPEGWLSAHYATIPRFDEDRGCAGTSQIFIQEDEFSWE